MTHPPTLPTEIALVGMRFHVRVGILAHERELPQPLEVDLRVRAAAGAAVVDYRGLHQVVARVVGSEPLEYLEEIADAVLAGAVALDGVTWARVAVRKPHVMLDGPVSYAEIVMERARG